MWYPHLFERLTIVDLPPANRHEMYRELKLEDKQTANGPIDVLFTSFTDLSVIRGSSIDMVWMGAAIEHVNEEDGLRVFKEVRRVCDQAEMFVWTRTTEGSLSCMCKGKAGYIRNINLSIRWLIYKTT